MSLIISVPLYYIPWNFILQICGHFFKTLILVLTYLSLASHKRDTSKQCRPRSDAAERGVWSGSTLFALNSEISTKHDNNNNNKKQQQPNTPYKGNGPLQRVKVEESTQHTWVKFFNKHLRVSENCWMAGTRCRSIAASDLHSLLRPVSPNM